MISVLGRVHIMLRGVREDRRQRGVHAARMARRDHACAWLMHKMPFMIFYDMDSVFMTSNSIDYTSVIPVLGRENLMSMFVQI